MLFGFGGILATAPLVRTQLAHRIVHALFEIFAFLLFALEGFSQTRLNDDACRLRRNCREQANFVTGKFPSA